MTRNLESKLSGSPIHMVGDGFRVRNYFPNGNKIGKGISPFFLLDYNPPFEFPPSTNPPGVGVHPHRGFETVTLALTGSVAHHDSAGNSGVIGPGDVQWMTAASGVLHKEYHEAEFARKGGEFHMLQLWVNLPKAFKMSQPRYQGILREQMPEIKIGSSSSVRVVAGEFEGEEGPAKTFSPLAMYVVDLNAGDEFKCTFPAHWNTAFLITRGDVLINGGEQATAEDLCLFKNEDGTIQTSCTTDSGIVVLAGEPINEPVAHYGPFVMNTVEELQQAFKDFQEGKFGELE